MRNYPVSTSIHLTRDPSYKVPLDHQIKRIIDAGFRYLDFNFLDHYYTPESPFTGDKWASWIDIARETAEKRGAKFNQAHAPFPTGVADPIKSKMIFEDVVRSMRNASYLGIKILLFIPFSIWYTVTKVFPNSSLK